MCKKEMPFLCFMPSSPVGNKQTPPGGTAGRPIFEYFFWKKPNLLCFLYLDLVRVLLFFASGSSFFGWVGGVGGKEKCRFWVRGWGAKIEVQLSEKRNKILGFRVSGWQLL